MLILNIVAILVFVCTGPFFAINFGSLGLSTFVTTLYAVHNLASWYAVKRITGLNTFFSFRDTVHLKSYLSTAQAAIKSD
jgi:hypothetical protein